MFENSHLSTVHNIFGFLHTPLGISLPMARPGKDGVPATGLTDDTFSPPVFSTEVGAIVTSLASVVELLSRDALCTVFSEASEG